MQLLLEKVKNYALSDSGYYKSIYTLRSTLDKLSDEEWRTFGEKAESGNSAAIFLISFYLARAEKEKSDRVIDIIGKGLSKFRKN